MGPDPLRHQVDSRIPLSKGPRHFLRGFVDRVVSVRRCRLFGVGFSSEGAQTQHAMIVGNAVFRIDFEHAIERRQRIVISLVQIKRTTQVAPSGPVVGKHLEYPPLGRHGLFVPAVFL